MCKDLSARVAGAKKGKGRKKSANPNLPFPSRSTPATQRRLGLFRQAYTEHLLAEQQVISQQSRYGQKKTTNKR